jgi:hypothetical protein
MVMAGDAPGVVFGGRSDQRVFWAAKKSLARWKAERKIKMKIKIKKRIKSKIKIKSKTTDALS